MRKIVHTLVVIGTLAILHAGFQAASVKSRGASVNYDVSNGSNGQACNNNDSPNGGDE